MNLHAFYIKHLWHFNHSYTLNVLFLLLQFCTHLKHFFIHSQICLALLSLLLEHLFWPIFILFCHSLCHTCDILSPIAASLPFPLSLYICSQCLSNLDIFFFCFSLYFTPLSAVTLQISPPTLYSSLPVTTAHTATYTYMHKVIKRKDKHICTEFSRYHYNALHNWSFVDGVLGLWKGVADCGMMGEVLSTLQTELFSTFKRVELHSEHGNLQEAGKCPQLGPV